MMDFNALSIEELKQLLKAALSLNLELKSDIDSLNDKISELERIIERLMGGPPSPPAQKTKPALPEFVKANVKKKPLEARKKRPHGFARTKQELTGAEEHFPKTCSRCNRKLTGGWEHATREIIELPSAPVDIIHHKIMARHCGVCNRREVASPDFSQMVVGKGRLGVRLMSAIAYFDTVCRMTVATIQNVLRSIYGLSLSAGEIVEVLHRVAHKAEPTYEALHKEIQSSPVVHADETGWREDGQSGYFWFFGNPQIQYFVGQRGRNNEVPKTALGENFTGILVSDFYCSYHWYQGRHQYCWVHLLRDLHKLHELHPSHPGVTDFYEGVKKIYKSARGCVPPDNPLLRRDLRRDYEAKLSALARQHQGATRPQNALASRIVRRITGLFMFVEYPETPSENNLAERSIRPLVVLRKMSGGTRSEKGSHTVAVLMSIFGTWKVRGLDLLGQCQQMLCGKPQVAPE